MTPMVDLAFLLLTFFMLTDAFTKHKAMEIALPKKPVSQIGLPPVERKNVLTLFPQPGDKLLYVLGTDNTMHNVDIANGDLKKLLEAHADNDRFWTIVKADDHARYEQMVAILDLLKQTHVPHYCLKDRDASDKTQLAQL